MRLSTLVSLIVLVLLFVWSTRQMDRPVPGDPLSNGRAEAVDGDSLRMNGEEMRLLGIDAPEFSQTCKRGGQDWKCGREAAQHLRRLLARAPVTCIGHERDRYNRLLVTCRSLGVDLGAAQVKAGMAIANGGYFVEEAEARNESRGLWAGEFDNPRDYRILHPSRQPAATPPQPQTPRPATVPTPPQRP
ncbi:MAG TPA: thermonuclease family protein [Beijerinckiaceae bacterium]|nr:thermonuclease family protein [Beijerinckiaceae bacterium]